MTGPRRLRSYARHVPGVPTARREMWLRRSLTTIRVSGLFDAAWYRLQSGFDGDDAAALDHYLRHGRRRGLSPATFFEPATFDRSWRTRVEDPFALFMRRPDLRAEQRWHSGVVFSRELSDLGGGRFAGPRPDDEVRVQLDREVGPRLTTTTTWATVDAHLRRAVKGWRQQEDARTTPTRTRRGPAAEKSFRQAMTTAPLPAHEHGDVLVSVVMPTWNRQSVVGAAVASVQAQTLGDWELVVVDDGSVDDTTAVLEGLAHFDDRIRVVRLPRSGVGRARNEAIARSRGRYVAFLDSDNTWEPDFLELMVKGMGAVGSRAAFAAVRMVGSGKVDHRVGTGRLEHLLVGNHVDLNALVVDADLLASVQGFAEDLRRTVDYDLVLRLSAVRDLDFLPFVGVVYDDGDHVQSDRISVREPLTWDFVTRSRHMVDWEAATSRVRDPDVLSVVTTTGSPRWSTTAALAAILEETSAGSPRPGSTSLEVVLVDRGGSRADSLALSLLELTDDRLTVVRTATDTGVPLALDIGLSHVVGTTVALLPPGTSYDLAGLHALSSVVHDADASSAQGVVVGLRELVTGAGTVVVRQGSCTPVLVDHPVTDLAAAADVVRVPGLYGGGLVASADDLVASRGLDPLMAGELSFTDLSIRLARSGARPPVVLPRVVGRSSAADWSGKLTHTDSTVFDGRHQGLPVDAGLLREIPLDVASVETTRDAKGNARSASPVLARPAGAGRRRRSLRWALITAAPAGPRGGDWGDVHFADALARSLRRLGQDAHVYRRHVEDRRSAALDDVRLVLRGLDPVVADPGRLTMTWVISHPDAVGDAELSRSEVVFAAGRSWAADAARRTGKDVRYLPQCTDPELFHPGTSTPSGRPARLFVGSSRRILRPSVAHLVAADVPLDVYGGGWEGLVPPEVVRGTYLANTSLGQAYWDAGLVLNDHWADMRNRGFLANRVLDAVASGARVISDHVDGLEELLGDSVRTWRTPTELLDLATAPLDEVFHDEATRRERARAVASDHSFDARARQLLDTATDLHG